MTPSSDLFEFVKGREGSKLKSYPDSKGVWTIGIGHTGPEVVEDLVWNDEQVKSAFFTDISVATKGVNSCVQVPLTQHEFDALVDLAFNIGVGAFMRSTLVKLLNQKDYAGADAQFKVWDKCGGRVLEGLDVRRRMEAELFNAA